MVERDDGSSVEETAAYAGGHRRLLIVAGAAAAALAIAGTVGALAARAPSDTLPALATPTVAPTAEATPTFTSMASPSATVTSSPSFMAAQTPTPTPSVTAARTPGSAPKRTAASSTPSTAPTTATGPGWSDPVTVAGKTYRARLVPSSGGEHNYDLELQRDGTTVFTPTSVFNTEGRWGLEESDSRVAFYLGGVRLTDLISVKGERVGDEVIGHVAVPTPDGEDVAGEPYVDLHVTIFRTPTANTCAPYGPDGWVVKASNGDSWDLSQD